MTKNNQLLRGVKGVSQECFSDSMAACILWVGGNRCTGGKPPAELNWPTLPPGTNVKLVKSRGLRSTSCEHDRPRIMTKTPAIVETGANSVT